MAVWSCFCYIGNCVISHIAKNAPRGPVDGGTGRTKVKRRLHICEIGRGRKV